MKYLSIVTAVLGLFWNTLQAQIVTKDSLWFNQDYTETTLRMEFGQALSQEAIFSTGLPFHFVFASPHDSISVASVQGNESFTSYDITFNTRPNTYYSLLSLDIKTQDGIWHSYSTNFFSGEDKSGLDSVKTTVMPPPIYKSNSNFTSDYDLSTFTYNTVVTSFVISKVGFDQALDSFITTGKLSVFDETIRKAVRTSSSYHFESISPTAFEDFGIFDFLGYEPVELYNFSNTNDSVMIFTQFIGRNMNNKDEINAPLAWYTITTDNDEFFVFDWKKENASNLYKPYSEWKDMKLDFLSLFTSNESVEHYESTKSFQITSTYPNPFNPSTQVQVNLSQAVELRLAVYDVLGRKVQSWQTPQRFASGSHQITLDLSGLASGTYVVELVGMNLSNGQLSRQTTMVSLVK